jgi:putative Mn2+ efflux pump MntP
VGTFAVVAAAVCCAVAWHVRHARAVLPRAAYRAYLATRLAILAAYCAAMAAVSVAYDAGRELRHGHLHHLYVGVVVASFARFNHPFSGALLALGAGVFVQGVGAYGFAPLLTEAGCQVIRMSVPMAKRLAEAAHCQWSEALVGGVTHLNFNMCPTDGVSLRAALHGQCGAQP